MSTVMCCKQMADSQCCEQPPGPAHLCVYTDLCICARDWKSWKQFSYSLHLKQISSSMTCSHKVACHKVA